MIVLLQAILFLSPISGPVSSSSAALIKSSSQVQVVDFAGLEKFLQQYEDRTTVINFWATWCVPCVKELPYFEQVTGQYDQDDVVVVLVSLDFSKQIDTQLKPFLKKNNLQSKVIVLDDPDQNTWIDKVDPRWSGAIPVTIIRKGDRQEFHEKSFHSFEELNTLIQSFLNS